MVHDRMARVRAPSVRIPTSSSSSATASTQEVRCYARAIASLLRACCRLLIFTRKAGLCVLICVCSLVAQAAFDTCHS